MKRCIKIDNHLKNVNLDHLSAVLEIGDLALQNRNFYGALDSYWRVFKKTCGFEMVKKIMVIYKRGDADVKATIRNRLSAAITHICSKVQDKSIKYGILFDFRELMLDNNLVTIVDRIDKIQRKIIKKNNIDSERTPQKMLSTYWKQAGTLIPQDKQTAIASSYGSKK